MIKQKLNILYILLLLLLVSCGGETKQNIKQKDNKFTSNILYIEGYKITDYHATTDNEAGKHLLIGYIDTTIVIIDTINKVVLGKPFYGNDSVPDLFVFGLARFKDFKTNKIGLYKFNGKIILPPVFDTIHNIKDSSLIVSVIRNKEKIKINLNAYTDTFNKLKLPYGIFYGNNGVLKVFPVNKKTKEIYFQFKSKKCGVIYQKVALIEKGYTKRYAIFSDNFAAIEINSITPGLCLNDSCTSYCDGSWDTYYKDKTKLRTQY